MAFSIIAAIGKKRELGKNGQLIWHLPKDLKFFKEKTSGHAILMGRKTFDSLPGMLPGRRHYVISRHSNETERKTLSTSPTWISDLPKFIQSHQNDPNEIFVIGGGSIYRELLPYCDTIYLTEIEATNPTADTFFPEIDKSKYKRKELGKGEDNGVKFTFVRYEKLN